MKNKIITDEQYLKLINKIVLEFHGDLRELELAIGILSIGRQFGWKVMYLMHSRKTIKRSEALLGIKIMEVLPETANRTEDSQAWKALQKVTNFWKAVKGEISGVRSTKTIEF